MSQAKRVDLKGDHDEIPEVLIDAWERINVCILCDAHDVPLPVNAYMVPDDPQLYGAPEGKQRIFPYRLCEPCSQSDNLGDAVDAKLLEISRNAG